MTDSTTGEAADELDGEGLDPTLLSPAGVGSEGDGPQQHSRFRQWAALAVPIFGLAGLAVAQPLLSLLGENPTYFTAHDSRPIDIVLLAVALVALPALFFVVPVSIIWLVSPRAGQIAGAVSIGLLGTLCIVGAIDASDEWAVPVFVAVVALGTALLAWCYRRARPLQLFVRYLAFAPILFVALFLFTSGVRPLVWGDDPAAVAAASRSNAPVIVLVFDEFSLGNLLRSDGTIDSDRFPGFAHLASMSTWYPNATTSANQTYMAIPAILTGQMPDHEAPPVAGQYPRSLFTMLGGSREVHAGELVSSICPRSICESDQDPAVRRSLARDTSIVGLHQLLPAALAERWLPSVSGSWTNFGNAASVPVPEDDIDLEFLEWHSRWAAGELSGHAVDYAGFLASLSGDGSPGLWYQHEMLPHRPYRYLPDGRSYDGAEPLALHDGNNWAPDPLSTVNARQRTLLQIKYVDTLVTAFLDRLDELGMLDESLIVVVSDHGSDLTPGRNGRGDLPPPEDEGDAHGVEVEDAVLPIPLFVKYPGQASAEVDERDAKSIDVLPTIADSLGTALPEDWEFDGRSLLADWPAEDQPRDWLRYGCRCLEQVSVRPSPGRLASLNEELFGPFRSEHDIYAVGPHSALLGSPVRSSGPALADASVSAHDPDAYADVDVEAPSIPVRFAGDVTGIDSGAWIALAVDDVVAGLGPVYVDGDGDTVVEIMIEPALLHAGSNDVSLYLVGRDSALQPLPAT